MQTLARIRRWSRTLAVLGAVAASTLCAGSALARSDTRENFCNEEIALAEPWLVWAASQHTTCSAIMGNRAQDTCFINALQTLLDLRTEYASVYRDRITTVSADHPVMKKIIGRLERNVESAQIIILSGDLTPSLITHQKMSCLNQP